MVPGAMRQRTVVLVTPDLDLRERITQHLLGMRWTVLGAGGGAEAMAYLGDAPPEAMIVDHWLPDLDAAEFLQHAATLCPATDLLQVDGSSGRSGCRSARRNELLHALREAQVEDNPIMAHPGAQAGNAGGSLQASQPAALQEMVTGQLSSHADAGEPGWLEANRRGDHRQVVDAELAPGSHFVLGAGPGDATVEPAEIRMRLPEMVGDSEPMCELERMIRMVAPHSATVLILGETGTGKELVAKAVHRLSTRASKAFVVLNCAAIPEHLLEAELFGHTRGAFTGAVTSRVGRIEAAHGGTLFLDEIGEMPLPLQAKMLRFLESGEIQRVGDNDTSHVDVRIVAATHQPLEAKAQERLFRLDLYHRLAVFPVEVPPLRERRQDIPMLVEFFLRKGAEQSPRKAINREALRRLCEASWEGNVRELCHVVQRATILAGDSPVITRDHLRMRSVPR